MYCTINQAMIFLHFILLELWYGAAEMFSLTSFRKDSRAIRIS